MTRSVVQMGTIVTVQVVGEGSDQEEAATRENSVERALAWFQRVEESCSRFDPTSELMRLLSHVGEPVSVSELLFEAVQFALAVAEESGGAFDPTVGAAMERRGFNREYRTGRSVQTRLQADRSVSYRDLQLDSAKRSITLLRPLILDLGAVVKGLAIDMAARELRRFEHFAIDAGGDLYLGGRNLAGESWSVGIRHPRRDRELIDSLKISDAAVCTSGDYERTSPSGNGAHHILDPRTGESAEGVASVTVVAPTAMAADALATAAFVLGPREGLRLLERQGVHGLIITLAMEQYLTSGMGTLRCGLDRASSGEVGVQGSEFSFQGSTFR